MENSNIDDSQSWKFVPIGNGWLRIQNMWKPDLSLRFVSQIPLLDQSDNDHDQQWKLIK